jgi:hypothetical protein
MTPQESREVIYGPVAKIIGGVFLAGFLAVTIFTVADGARGRHEAFSETTAAGDTNHFTVPADPAASEPVFLADGRRFVLASREKVKIHDTDMVRTLQDVTGDYIIYSRRSAPGKEFFVKTAVSEYLPLRVR